MRRQMLVLATMVCGLALAACGNAATTTTSTTPITSPAVGETTGATTTGADTTPTTMMAETPSVAGTAAISGTAATTGTAMMDTTATTTGAASDATAGPDTAATVLAAAASNPTSAGTPTAFPTVIGGAATATVATTATPLSTVVVSGTTTTGGAMSDVVTAITTNGNLTTLLTALQATGLDKQLDSLPAFTVFAPTDAAFAALPAGVLEKLLADPATLTKILSYHVAQSKLMAADVAKATTIPTVEGQAIKVAVSGTTVTLNGDTKVTATDISAGKGVIHTIDKVLLPPDVTLPK